MQRMSQDGAHVRRQIRPAAALPEPVAVTGASDETVGLLASDGDDREDKRLQKYPLGNYRGCEMTTFHRWDFAARQVIQGITEHSYTPLRNPLLFMCGVTRLTNGEDSLRYTGYTQFNMTELTKRLSRLGATVTVLEGMGGAGGEFQIALRLPTPTKPWVKVLAILWALALVAAIGYVFSDYRPAIEQALHESAVGLKSVVQRLRVAATQKYTDGLGGV